MGVYLSTPSIEKLSTDETFERMSYGASSMQGWRKSQEDAHNSCLQFDPDTKTALFAVYDGHGGAEVAEYAANRLPDVIKHHTLYKENKLPEALTQSFLDFDASIIDEEAQKELHCIAQLDKVESADEHEVSKLNEEAEQPIEEVLENYGGVDELPDSVKDVFKKNKRFRKTDGQKYESPALRAKMNGQDNNCLEEVKAKPEGNISNGHLDENENGHKCNSTVESSTTSNSRHSSTNNSDKATAVNEASTTSCDDQVSCTEVSSSSSKPEPVGGGSDDQCSSTDDKSATENKVSSDSNELHEPNEPSSSNVREAENNDEDEEYQATEEWSDTSSEGEEEEGEDDSDEEMNEDEDEEDGRGMMNTFGDDEKPGYDSGCTAVVALVREGQLHVANAGDSRCVLCRGGKAVDLSIDHKPEDEVELARIKRAGGMVSFDGRVNGGLNLSRALGDHCYKGNLELELKEQMISGLPDIQSTSIQDDDQFMIIACDGIWNSLTSQEVVDFISERIDKSPQLSHICEELFDRCLAPNTSGDGTGCDNMTALIVKFHHSTHSNITKSNGTEVTMATTDIVAKDALKTGVKRSAADSVVESNQSEAESSSSSKRVKLNDDSSKSDDCTPQSTVESTG